MKLFHQTVIHEGWLALVGITFSLGIVGMALLVHLFGFHCYLSKYAFSILVIHFLINWQYFVSSDLTVPFKTGPSQYEP